MTGPSRLRLSLACGRYDINQGLIDGSVRPQGVDLVVTTAPSPERHRRLVRHLEFDIGELSLATYLMLHARPDNPFTGIPAFPHRRFRHGFIFVNASAGIHEPRDLQGRRVGIRSWETTAGLWCRGLLQDDYGVDLRAIHWVSQDDEDIPFEPPTGLTLERIPAGATVTGWLVEGRLDALIYPEVPAAIREGDPRVRRLFSDPKTEEMAWYRRTGLFPIMHTVVIRRDLLAAHPWLAVNLLEAFRAAKDMAFARLADPRSISLAWVSQLVEEQRAVLGPDPWAYAFEPNEAALTTAIRWAHEQGLIARPYAARDLFAASTLEALPTYV